MNNNKMTYCIKCGSTTKKLLHHHEQYNETHGRNHVVLMCKSCHVKLHSRLRKEGKCNISVEKLKKISITARNKSPIGQESKKNIANLTERNARNMKKITLVE